jgi:hypothetical protein
MAAFALTATTLPAAPTVASLAAMEEATELDPTTQ